MVLIKVVLGNFAFGACVLAAFCQTVSVVNTSAIVNSTGGNIDVYLKVEPVAKGANLPELIASDVTGPGKSAFQQIGNPTFVGRSDTKAYWRTSWHPDGQAANLAPVRVLWIQFGMISELVSVTLQKPGDPQVKVTGPGYPLKLGDSHDVAFQIVSSARLTHVVPSFASLVEEKTGQVIAVDQLSIVGSSGSGQNTADGVTVEIPSQVVHLTVASDFTKPGKFTGNVSLASREKADLGSFAVTIYSTAPWRKAVGGLCLVVGVAIYFGVAIWAKARNKQLLAALPAGRLREETQSLKNFVLDARAKTSAPFANLLDAASNPNSIDSLIESLSLKALKSKGYLPQDFFSPFSGQEPSPSYQTFLAGVGNQVTVLEVIIRWGIGAVLKMWPDVEKAGKQGDGTTALKNLDGLAGTTLPSDQLKAMVQAEINAVQSAIASAKGVTGGAAPWHAVGEMGSREITIQLQQLSIFVWILWGAATIFVGLCALVFFNDAFGRSQDWIQCLLWGIGMPAVAQGFGGLSANSVSSALSLPIPR
jgi:hypothetical protein